MLSGHFKMLGCLLYTTIKSRYFAYKLSPKGNTQNTWAIVVIFAGLIEPYRFAFA